MQEYLPETRSPVLALISWPIPTSPAAAKYRQGSQAIHAGLSNLFRPIAAKSQAAYSAKRIAEKPFR